MTLFSTNDHLPSEPTLRSIERGLDRLEPSLAKLTSGLSLVESLARADAADAIEPGELNLAQRLEGRPNTIAQENENRDRANVRGGALVQIHDAVRARSEELPPPFGPHPATFPGLFPTAAGAAFGRSDGDLQPRDLVELAGRLQESAPRGADSVAGKFDREIRDGVASLVHEGVKIKNPEALDRQARFV